MLCIWDGFGLAPASPNNPTSIAKLPNLKRLLKEYPWTTLDADGDSVGQEMGLVGNSEVGHMNLGGLQLVKQLSFQITQSAENGFKYDSQVAPDQMFDPEKYLTLKWLKDLNTSKTIHLAGLFSTGTIHSDMRHWVGAVEAAGRAGADQIVLHLVSDGRDSDRQSLEATWNEFETKYRDRLKPFQDKIYLGSLGGRFYAMDRDKNWGRVFKGLSKMVQLQDINQLSDFSANYPELDLSSVELNSLSNAVHINDGESSLNTISGIISGVAKNNYTQNIFDENIEPTSIQLSYQLSGGEASDEIETNLIEQGSVVWLINFRSDRMKQLTNMLCDLNQELGLNLTILANNDYGIGKEILLNSDLEDLKPEQSQKGYYPVFKTRAVQNTLSQRIAKTNATQLHIAETEKYAHVTYFFDGGVEQKQVGEEWVVIPSNKVASHAEKPEMKAVEVTDYILENGLGKFDYIIVNYANPDMVGHTGDIPASIKALEVLDEQLGRLLEVVERDGHAMLITADHGNVEKVGEFEHEGKQLTDTEHNADPVPCIVINSDKSLSGLINNLKNNPEIANQNIVELIESSLTQSQVVEIDEAKWLSEDQIIKPKLPLWTAGLITLLM